MKFGVVSRKRRGKGAGNEVPGVVIQGFSCINRLLELFLYRVICFLGYGQSVGAFSGQSSCV